MLAPGPCVIYVALYSGVCHARNPPRRPRAMPSTGGVSTFPAGDTAAHTYGVSREYAADAAKHPPGNHVADSRRTMSTLAERLRRIDVALDCRRIARYVAEGACHHEQARIHGAEIDRLLDLKVRIVRGHGRMTAFIPERKGD